MRGIGIGRWRRRLAAGVIGALLTACGGGGGGGGESGGDDEGPAGGSVQLSASVGSGYSTAYRPGPFERLLAGVFGRPAQALTGDTAAIDKAVAIPNRKGHVDPGLFSEIQTATLDSDGGFSLSLDTSYEYVVLLVDSDAANPQDRVVAYVTTPAKDDTSQELDSYPTGKAKGDMNLGDLSQSTSNPDKAKAANEAGSGEVDFELTGPQIAEMARTDNAYRNLVNLYVNWDAANDHWYTTQPSFNWGQRSGKSGGRWADIDGSFPDPASYNYNGFLFYLVTSDEVWDFNKLCAGGQILAFYPPGTVKAGDGTSYDAGTPMQNDNVTGSSGSCSDDDVYIEEETDGEGGIRANFRTGLSYSELLQSTPGGWWELKADEHTVAHFDLDVTNPLTDPTDNASPPEVFVPAPKVTTKSTGGELDTISVNWKRWDGDQYIDVDPASMKATVYQSFVELNPVNDSNNDVETLYGADIGEGAVIEEVTASEFNQIWHSQSGTEPVIEKVTVSYEMGGVQYRFEWLRQ